MVSVFVTEIFFPSPFLVAGFIIFSTYRLCHSAMKIYCSLVGTSVYSSSLLASALTLLCLYIPCTVSRSHPPCTPHVTSSMRWLALNMGNRLASATRQTAQCKLAFHSLPICRYTKVVWADVRFEYLCTKCKCCLLCVCDRMDSRLLSLLGMWLSRSFLGTSAKLHGVMCLKVFSNVGNYEFTGIRSGDVIFSLLGCYSAYVGSSQTLQDGPSW